MNQFIIIAQTSPRHQKTKRPPPPPPGRRLVYVTKDYASNESSVFYTWETPSRIWVGGFHFSRVFFDDARHTKKRKKKRKKRSRRQAGGDKKKKKKERAHKRRMKRDAQKNTPNETIIEKREGKEFKKRYDGLFCRKGRRRRRGAHHHRAIPPVNVCSLRASFLCRGRRRVVFLTSSSVDVVRV